MCDIRISLFKYIKWFYKDYYVVIIVGIIMLDMKDIFEELGMIRVDFYSKFLE